MAEDKYYVDNKREFERAHPTVNYDIYMQGRVAYRDGHRTVDNPHIGGELGWSWWMGWMDAMQEVVRTVATRTCELDSRTLGLSVVGGARNG